MSDWPTMPAPAGVFSNRYKPTDMPDLSGKVALVVGGSRGIGEGISKALAHKGAEVHILSATEAHAEEAVDNIAEASDATTDALHTHTVDLGDLKSLISTTDSLASSLPRLDLLYLTAGIGVAPWGLTKDGLGNHFAVNNLSQLLVVDQLLPLLKKTAEGKQGDDRYTTRIVSESSELHRTAPGDVQFADLEEVGEARKEESPLKLYGMSKLGNALFIKQLSQHLPALSSDTPIIAISVHPGGVATEQQKGATESYGLAGKLLEKVANATFMSKEQGAESALWAGTSPNVSDRREEVQGQYFSEADGKVGTESDQAKDDALGKRLWALCVKTLKDKAGYEVKM